MSGTDFHSPIPGRAVSADVDGRTEALPRISSDCDPAICPKAWFRSRKHLQRSWQERP